MGNHEFWFAGRELHVAVREADGQRYVLVNAGDYSMVFVDDGRPVFQSLVIVGQLERLAQSLAALVKLPDGT